MEYNKEKRYNFQHDLKKHKKKLVIQFPASFFPQKKLKKKNKYLDEKS